MSFAREKFVRLDQVRADPELTPLAFMLAYVIANLVNEREGYAWPSVARLAGECRATENGVKKIIRRLVERGHLSVELGIGRGKTNRYRWLLIENDARRDAEGQNECQRNKRG
ncbi:MAG: helix-turn-helix domain-containing protein [Methylocystis sp.]